jgi:hypothetical protein
MSSPPPASGSPRHVAGGESSGPSIHARVPEQQPPTPASPDAEPCGSRTRTLQPCAYTITAGALVILRNPAVWAGHRCLARGDAPVAFRADRRLIGGIRSCAAARRVSVVSRLPAPCSYAHKLSGSTDAAMRRISTDDCDGRHAPIGGGAHDRCPNWSRGGCCRAVNQSARNLRLL